MARGKKWTVPFESLGGITCRVDIYEEGYSGSVTTLSASNANAPGVPAAVPFEIQEDDSNDLTQFIRFKTGVLRLVELTYGGLNALMPQSIHHHFVEAYYGTERVFSGFMQCQEFDNDWVEVPRTLEFPVISPLGLLDAYNFNAPSEPGLVTLGSLMKEVMIRLNPAASNANDSDYTGVIYPDGNYGPWDNIINSTVLVPFNSGFKHYDSASEIYEPKDFKYFIDGICACFGWMVHDTPDNIVFTKYDYVNQSYSRLTVAGLLNPSSGWSWVQQRAASFSSYYENADNNAMQSVVMPLKEIVLNLEGVGVKDKSLNTDHSTSPSLTEGGVDPNQKTWRGAKLTQIGPDVSGTHLGTAVFTTYGELSNAGLFPIGYGFAEANAKSISIGESWVLKHSTSWPADTQLIRAVFYGCLPMNSSGACLLKLKIERGTSLLDMHADNYDSITLNLVIKVGSLYYNMTSDQLTSTLTFNSVVIDGATGRVTPNKTLVNNGDYNDVDGIIFSPTANAWDVTKAVEVMLYKSSATNLNDGEYLRFAEISLNNPSGIDAPYNRYYESKDTLTIGNNATGTESKDITVNFHNYIYHRGEHSFGNSSGDINGNPPTFPYMFAPLTVLTQKVKRTATPDFNEYAALWTYWISNWRWRMIAHNFNLVDDEHQITLARSYTIE